MTLVAALTLEGALHAAFGRLAEGARDGRSPFRTPALATLGRDGAPQLRTVVLRGFDPAARSLSIHTDRRSAKVAELAADPRAALHVYDAAIIGCNCASPGVRRCIATTPSPMPPGRPAGRPAA